MDDAFELSVLDTGNPNLIIAIARSRDDVAIEQLPCNLLTNMTAFRKELAGAARGDNRGPTLQRLSDFGEMLFRFVFQSNVLKIYNFLPAAAHTRLQIISTHAEVQALPWEYMCYPNEIPGVPNANRSVVRVVPTVGVPSHSPAKHGGKLRLLYVFADPVDQEDVEWEEIKSCIIHEFALRKDIEVEIDVLEGASPTMLFDALDRKEYDVMHFVGHGQVAADGVGELLFINRQTKKSEPLSASKLGMLVKGKKSLKMVVLSSCDTSAGDFTEQFAVVAKTLVLAGVPVVVANQFPVTNSMSAKFAAVFYRELLKTGDVDLAVTSGRIKLALEPPRPGSVARIEWGIPTLYRHISAGRLWQP